VNQSPILPLRNLDTVLLKVQEIVYKEFREAPKDFYTKDFESEESLVEWLDTTLKGIPEFEEWNLSQNEFLAKVKVDDPNRPEVMFVGRGFSTNKNDDFIDLDACIRNIARLIIRH
jgi:hypothetical protein